MARKHIKVSRAMLFTWFMLAGLILLIAPQKLTSKFQFAFARIFQLPLSVTRTLSINAGKQQSAPDVVSRDQYNQLQNHLANVRAQLEIEHKKVELLTGMLDRLPLEGAKTVIAYVITASTESTKNQIVINRGEKDGLAVGQFALGDNSVIGKVSEVDARFAWIKLLSDPGLKIPVKISGLGADYILSGNGTSAKIRLITTKTKIETGQEVYAAKQPGILDTPVILGKIGEYKEDQDDPLLWDITVEPVCNIEKLKTVVVIIMNTQK